MKYLPDFAYYGQSRITIRLIIFLAVMTGLSGVVRAQEYTPSTSSPYNTVFTHLYFLQADSYRPDWAAKSIDSATIPDSALRVRRCIQLKQILDAEGLFVNLEQLPKQMDYVDTTNGKSEYTLFPTEKPQIYLIQKGENWFYSPQTVNLIPELHQKLFPFGSTFLMNLFPAFGHKTFFGLAIWQYIGMAIFFLLAFILYWIIHRLLRPVVRKVLKNWMPTEALEQVKHIDRLASALGLLLILQVIRFLIPMLLLPINTGLVVTKGISLLQIVCIALVLMRVSKFFVFYLRKVVGRTESKMDDQLLPLVQKMITLIIIVGALLQILSLLQVNVTALIAGVSIGGLAIALAAQDAVKNFIGSIMIFADKPFQIGDYVVGSGFEGEVKEVGFRTTRIQALDTSIVAVPNGSIANMNIENKGVRVMRLFNTVINLTYDSKPDQLKAYVEDLKKLIIEHPRVADINYYVHIKELASSSINVMFRAYLDVPGYADELAIKEELIYSIMELAEKNGLEFAFPSQTIYTKKI